VIGASYPDIGNFVLTLKAGRGESQWHLAA
jgi:hypothetical protein